MSLLIKQKPAQKERVITTTLFSKAGAKEEALPELKTKKDIKESKEDIFKKLTEFVKGKELHISELLNEKKKTSRKQVVTLFADLSEKKPISANLFKEILNFLLKTGKITKHDISEILFDYMEKDYITRKEVAGILSSLKII